jgi:hypothetical protein
MSAPPVSHEVGQRQHDRLACPGSPCLCPRRGPCSRRAPPSRPAAQLAARFSPSPAPSPRPGLPPPACHGSNRRTPTRDNPRRTPGCARCRGRDALPNVGPERPAGQGRPTGQETAMRRLALARAAAGGVLAASPGLSRVHGRQPIPAAGSGELPSNRRGRHPRRNPLPTPVPRTTGPPARPTNSAALA